METDERYEGEFQRRRAALVEPLRNDALHAFLRWSKVNNALLVAMGYTGSGPTLADVQVVNAARPGRPPEWFAYINAPSADELGSGIPMGSPVDALILFCCWCDRGCSDG